MARQLRLEYPGALSHITARESTNTLRIVQDVVTPDHSKWNSVFDLLKREPMGHINAGLPNVVGSFDTFHSERGVSKIGGNEESKLFLEAASNFFWKFFIRSVKPG
jgi:hypothetical protein